MPQKLTQIAAKNVRSKIWLRNEGFSVVELIVMLVVIGILAAISVPMISGHLRAYHLDTSSTMVRNLLMEARMDAVKRNRNSILYLDLAERTAQIKSIDNAGNVINVGFPQRFQGEVVLDGDVSVSVSFDSMGRVSGGGTQTATLRERTSNKRKPITISPAGKVEFGPVY